jgi:predicted transcriptional regulator
LALINKEGYMRERIFNYIKDFGSITTFEAFTELGCTRLSEYIRQLRLEHNIKDTWITSTNRYGEKIQFKKYWLEEGD